MNKSIKPLPFKIAKTAYASFLVQEDQQPYLYDVLHAHPEIQLTLVVQSDGIYSIAHQMGRFEAGDLFLIGANVPHVFKNSDQWYTSDHPSMAHAISIFFRKDSFGKELFDVPEFIGVKKLLEGAERGIKLSKPLAVHLSEEMKEMLHLTGASRIIRLLSLLEKIASHQGWDYLSPPIEQRFQKEDYERLNNILAYILEHYERPISLDDIAREAHLSPSAFCRFFKKRTRKSFVEYLNEFRVGMACKMLLESKEPIARICYQTGFNNLANFNRQFRRVMGLTPTAYRKKLKVLGM